jgi:hypothetical protein
VEGMSRATSAMLLAIFSISLNFPFRLLRRDGLGADHLNEAMNICVGGPESAQLLALSRSCCACSQSSEERCATVRVGFRHSDHSYQAVKGRALEPQCKGPLLRHAPVTDNPRSLAHIYLAAPAPAFLGRLNRHINLVGRTSRVWFGWSKLAGVDFDHPKTCRSMLWSFGLRSNPARELEMETGRGGRQG